MLGPTTTILGSRYGNYYSVRVGYTTPFGEERKPTPHDFYEVKMVSSDFPAIQSDLPNHSAIHYMNSSWGRGSGADMGDVSNKARSRFFSKVHGDVQGLVNLAEYRQTWGTLASLLGALRRPTRALEKAYRSYAKAAKGQNNAALLAKPLRQSADGWLAWHFGVEPLLNDIFATVDLLTNGIPPPKKVSESAKGRLVYSAKEKPCPNSNWSHYETYLLRCRLRGTVEITNPNLWLANSLGLLNPAAVAWELVPWSFAFDWIFNVGQFVQQLSDEFGVSITDQTTTYSCHVNDGVQIYTDWVYPCNWYPTMPYDRKTFSVRGYRWKRQLGLTSVDLGTVKTAPWSLTRIGTAAALLMQQLPHR